MLQCVRCNVTLSSDISTMFLPPSISLLIPSNCRSDRHPFLCIIRTWSHSLWSVTSNIFFFLPKLIVMFFYILSFLVGAHSSISLDICCLVLTKTQVIINKKLLLLLLLMLLLLLLLLLAFLPNASINPVLYRSRMPDHLLWAVTIRTHLPFV